MVNSGDMVDTALHSQLKEDRSRSRYDTRKNPEKVISDFNSCYAEPAVYVKDGVTPKIIRIIFEDPSDCPWTIEIQTEGFRSVTLGEVWTALYKGLNEKITPSEWSLYTYRLPFSLSVERQRAWRIASSERRRELNVRDKSILRVDWLKCSRGVYFVGLRRDDNLAKKLLLPGMAPCEYTYVAKFSTLAIDK